MGGRLRRSLITVPSGGVRVPGIATLEFTDPEPYQRAIRGAKVELLVTAKGDFRAELTQICLPRLSMQRARENLPRVLLATINPDRAPISFLTRPDQPAIRHCGLDVTPSDIIVSSRSPMQRRTSGPCHWGTASLTPEEFAAAGLALVGRELTVPSITHLVRPSPALMSRLLDLHEAAERLGRIAPDLLAQPEVARALENALVHAMIACLTEGKPVEMTSGGRHHAAIVARFEEFLAANHHRALYLTDICNAVGASERTLRASCREHLGMGPVRYLWLRRMHLTHRALILATPEAATVTEIATEHGFWELGRLSIEYRALFGETPSASLRRAPVDPRTSHGSPFAFADSGLARLAH